jgi:catechol 2,3-dioxygenase-like lactoylglutathione lyase family enzyme
MSDSEKVVIPLGFTKLIVEDIDAMSRFYGVVCGFEEEGRGEDQIAGRPIREAYFRSDPPGTGTFTLTKFLDTSRPVTESLILGFVAPDIDVFVDTAIAAGAQLIEPVQSRPEHGVKVAFIKDIEGNLVEVVEIL